ncbi:phosphatidyl inositol kinase, partial [Rhizopus stolonifer]
ATRRFFQDKLPTVFRKDMCCTTASFSSLPAVIVADLQSGNIPLRKHGEESHTGTDQGWTIIRRRRYRGKHGIGEARHPNDVSSPSSSVLIDEEIDPSDQVTCSVFVKWQPLEEQAEYSMAVSPLLHELPHQKDKDERSFDDPIPVTEEKFKEIIKSVQEAIENNMQPTRISQGSSGSYFCRNSSGKIVGVFKPKNEEPYGRLNPKWTKWIHRHLFPCFFGRSCLIPNLGYLSEAGASLIDRKLGTMIVPYTDVIYMSSPSFHYDYLDRRSQHGLPPKIGSFQCFLTDYKDATVFFRNHPYPINTEHTESINRKSVWAGCLGRNETMQDEFDEEHLLPEEDDSDHTHVTPNHQPSKKHDFRWTYQLQHQFCREFEQLVILDYLIRNTDRGLDNWMIKHCPSQRACSSKSSLSADEPTYTPHKIPLKTGGHIHVAAIDNGLAFPYKHPDQWRSYPYGWSTMHESLVNRPFSEATRKQFLPILSDPLWWRDTVRDMRALFELDDDFDEKMFQKQMAVLKGQGFNIVRTLKDPHAGPIDLVTMQRVVINQEEIVIEYDERALSHVDSTPIVSDTKRKQQRPRKLRTQRSTSFDVISTTSSPFRNILEERHENSEEDEESVSYFSPPLPHATRTTLSAPTRQQQQQQQKRPRWKDRIKSGLSMDLGRHGLFGKKNKNKKNRYRAFDSDGDLSDDSEDSDDDSQAPVLKRVTVIMETIEIVKSRTYFTCW